MMKGGTNIWANYGPYDLQPGESIVIVEAEGVSGINRQLCETIGARWKQAYDDQSDAVLLTCLMEQQLLMKMFIKIHGY